MKQWAQGFWSLFLCIMAARGLVSFFIPMGMDCDGSYSFNKSRPCAFGPGIVGVQECHHGKWDECEAPKVEACK